MSSRSAHVKDRSVFTAIPEPLLVHQWPPRGGGQSPVGTRAPTERTASPSNVYLTLGDVLCRVPSIFFRFIFYRSAGHDLPNSFQNPLMVLSPQF